MKRNINWLLIGIIFVHFINVSAQQTNKQYYAVIKYMNRGISVGKLIAFQDSSLSLLVRYDTLIIRVKDIRSVKIKIKRKHRASTVFITGGIGLIIGIRAYTNYAPNTSTITVNPGRGFVGVLASLLGGTFVGGPIAGLTYVLKEIPKKKYHLKGSKLIYDKMKDSLSQYK